jgi:hypothetical protein
VKHTLKLAILDDSRAAFQGRHQLVEHRRRTVGTEPYGPFSLSLGTSMYREDWEAAGRPLELEVDL